MTNTYCFTEIFATVKGFAVTCPGIRLYFRRLKIFLYPMAAPLSGFQAFYLSLYTALCYKTFYISYQKMGFIYTGHFHPGAVFVGKALSLPFEDSSASGSTLDSARLANIGQV